MGPEMNLVLLVLGVCFSLGISKQYFFVNKAKTYSEAQDYCRKHFSDLATVEDEVEFFSLQATVSGIVGEGAWIGLKKDDPDWIWSLCDHTFYKEGEAEYRHWKAGQLDNDGGQENCGAMGDGGEFWDVPCENKYEFICYNGKQNVVERYVFVNKKKTWSEAQKICRQDHTDLVSVRSLDENRQVQELVPSNTLVFIGLFKDTYRWSDNSQSSYRRWAAGEPDNTGACVQQRLSDVNTWADQNCTKTRPFICQGDMKRQILRVMLKAGHNVDDPVVKKLLLEKIQQTLERLGTSEDARLGWRVQPDGEIFHPLEEN